MSPTILIVDDHPGFRRSVVGLLASDGWSVVGEAGTGEEGIEAVDHCDPDVVLLDVGLPDISGIEVARRLRQSNPELPVVLISTHDRADYGDLALDAGAKGFISKLDLSGEALRGLVGS